MWQYSQDAHSWAHAELCMHDTGRAEVHTQETQDTELVHAGHQNTQSYTKDAELQSAGYVITHTGHAVTRNT